MDKRIDNFNLNYLGDIITPPPANSQPSTLQKIFSVAKTIVNSIPKNVKDAALQKILGNNPVEVSYRPSTEYTAPGYTPAQVNKSISFNPMIIVAVIVGVMLMFIIIKKLL